MSKVRLHGADEIPWTRIGDMTKNRGVLTEGELASQIRFSEPGAGDSPQLMELDYVPDAVIAPHFHDSAEILYIVEGEMHFGDRVLGPGASVFIAGEAVYSYRAGPKGLKVLNFRPHADYSYHPRGAA